MAEMEDSLADPTQRNALDVSKDDDFTFEGTSLGCVAMEGEIMMWNLWRACIAEMWGTALFLFLTIGTVTATDAPATLMKVALGTSLNQGRQFMIAYVFGFMITILVYTIAPISGGNLNPAVSVALALSKKISPLRMIMYIISQCIGATIGCALVKAVDENSYNAVGGAVNSITTGYTTGGAFLAEFICTSLLVLCVFAAVDPNNGHRDRANMKQSMGVLCIGMCVFVAHCVLIPITNCSINPARSFGASLVAGEWPDHWIWWAAPIVGGIFSCLLYEAVLKDRPLNRSRPSARLSKRPSNKPAAAVKPTSV